MSSRADEEGGRRRRRERLLLATAVLGLLVVLFGVFVGRWPVEPRTDSSLSPTGSSPPAAPAHGGSQVTTPETARLAAPGPASSTNRQRAAPTTRRVTGTTRTLTGRPLAADVVLRSGDRTFRVRSDADGRFTCELAAMTGNLDIEATTAAGHRDRRTLLADAVDDSIDMKLRRFVDVTTRLHVDERILRALGDRPAARVRVEIAREAGGMLALFQSRRSLDPFTLQQTEATHSTQLDLGDYAVTLSWSFVDGDSAVRLHDQTIPPDLGVVTSECTIDLRMLLTGTLRDRPDSTFGGVPIQVWTEQPRSLLFTLSTDENGAFATLVPRDAHGWARVPWLIENPWELSTGGTAWFAGQVCTIDAPLSDRLRISVVHDGALLSKFGLARYPAPTRTDVGGLPPASLPSTGPLRQVVTEWRGLRTADRLFVRLPNRELVWTAPRDVDAGSGTLTLADAIPCDASLRLLGLTAYQANLRLTERRDEAPVRYLLTAAGPSYTATDLMPGEYECTVETGGKELLRRTVRLQPAQTTTIRLP